MRRDPNEKTILIGKIVRPHGLDGTLRIKSYAQSEDSYLHVNCVFIKEDGQAVIKYKVLSIKPHKGLFLLKLEGIDSLEKAEHYRDANIYISEYDLENKNDDEYFWYELKGISVYLNTGELLGTIKDIINTGSNDIFVIKTGSSDLLIPALREVVESIDIKNRKMIVSHWEELLDLNEI